MEAKLPEPVEKSEKPIVTLVAENKPVEAQSTEAVGTVQAAESSQKQVPQPLLMVEVVNVTHEKFKQTEEIKVSLLIYLFLSMIFSHVNVDFRL